MISASENGSDLDLGNGKENKFGYSLTGIMTISVSQGHYRHASINFRVTSSGWFFSLQSRVISFLLPGAMKRYKGEKNCVDHIQM